MDSGYGWCQSCGALVFNSPQCHKCDGKVKPFCVDITLVKQAERIEELEVENEKNKKLKLFVKTLKDKAQFAQIPNYVLIKMCEQALEGK